MISSEFINEDNKFELLPWREVDMSLYINTLPKNKRLFFMKMYRYQVVKCNGTFHGFSTKKNTFIQQKTNKCL